MHRRTNNSDVGALTRAAPLTTQVTSARNVDDAVVALSQAYSDVTVRLPSADETLRMRLTTHTLPNVALGDLELTSSIVRSARYPWFAVCLPDSGQVRISTDRATTLVSGQQGAIVAPGAPVQVEYLSKRCRMRTILFDRSLLEVELSTMLGRTAAMPLSFDFGIQHSSSNAFGRSLALLSAELYSPDGLANITALAPRLGRLVMAGLLASCRHNYSAELHDPAGGHQPRVIRNAVDAIESDPAGIETVADIARASGLSVRALDAGFRRHVGIPPMKYLRQVRLARAHDALLAADAESTTATTVAHEWGFLHYGRFAAEYRRAYGRTPSQSLRSTPCQ